MFCYVLILRDLHVLTIVVVFIPFLQQLIESDLIYLTGQDFWPKESINIVALLGEGGGLKIYIFGG